MKMKREKEGRREGRKNRREERSYNRYGLIFFSITVFVHCEKFLLK
jgi:hypothetical protein